MIWTQLLSSALRRWNQPQTTRRAKRLAPPCAESLEDRLLLSGMTIQVTNTNDSGAGSLRNAIDRANARAGEDRITFSSRVRGEIELSSQLIITDDLILDGPGANKLTVSGEGQTRVFVVLSSDVDDPTQVEFRDLTIANGLATDAFGLPPGTAFAFGGGILNVGGELTLKKVSFEDNQAGTGIATAVGAGGALANVSGGTADIVSSEFEGNTAIGVGGAIYNSGELTVARSTFEDNTAIGDVDVVVAASPAFQFVGGAIGGGIINYGTLSVTNSDFLRNSAIGADDADSGMNSFFAQQPVFAGNAFVGAIGNFGGFASATIEKSQFLENDAIAGDRGKGEFASIAGGGAVANDSVLTVDRSEFHKNRAIGGDEAISPFHNGHSLGGAINSGSLFPAFGGPGATLVVTNSVLTNNESLGGNNNQVTLPAEFIPPADAPNNGYGGGILVYQGSATIEDSSLRNNRAIGGDGGADFNGSLGVGGGVFFFSFLGPVTANVSDTEFIGNLAIGGEGGDGIGGGIATGTLGAPFGAPGLTTITDSLFRSNQTIGGDGTVAGDGIGGGLAVALGGMADVSSSIFLLNRARGGNGQIGGDGQGGGIAVAEGGRATLAQSLVSLNKASGGSGSDDDGAGQGGGGFNGGVADDFTLDAVSLFWMQFNSATDDGDAIFGPFDLI